MTPSSKNLRMTEVCLACGGEAGYAALLVRRRSAATRLRGRLADADADLVQPLMTRAMLEALMHDLERDTPLRAGWDGDEVVLSASGDTTREQRRLRPDELGLYAVGSFASVGGYDWTWMEITPPWPSSGTVDASTIVGLLTASVSNTWPISNQIKAKADILELASALSATDDVTVRERICHLLAHRTRGDAARSTPALLALLRQPHAGLRAEAADAILQIARREGRRAVLDASPGAGDALQVAVVGEVDPRVRAMLAGALGALRHEPAVPQLIWLLKDDEWLVRREGAEALGALRAPEAESALHHALVAEADPYVAEAMRSALASITGKELTDLAPLSGGQSFVRETPTT
jgi:HEAT repeats